jgi:RNA polymerase sigma-70 factor (ECF subfamily)
MAEAPQTRASLLVRLRDGRDEEAWRQFLHLYGPLVYAYGRRSGLQDADAADLTQCVFQEVSGAIRRLDYDPAQGTFRGWLFTIARRQLGKLRQRSLRQPLGSGDTTANVALDDRAAAEDAADAWWEQEYKRQRFYWAADRVRPHVQEATWQAFWQTAVEGKVAAEVAAELGLSVGVVYTAKSRVLDRLKREIQALEEG